MWRADDVLHLHGFHNDERLARSTRWPDAHADIENDARHRGVKAPGCRLAAANVEARDESKVSRAA